MFLLAAENASRNINVISAWYDMEHLLFII